MRKMKKDERHLLYIRNQAYELAYSGKGRDWLSIEFLLRAEGWTEARRILDNDNMRKELNDICNIANSPIEIENRASFKRWIKDFVGANTKILNQEYVLVQQEMEYSYKQIR
ncbi:MAG: hypothetical protein ACYDA4_05960 [Ignavibacteriaceae bacterium]